MSSVGRWDLTRTELEIAVHAFLLEVQLNGSSFRNWFFACMRLAFRVVHLVA